MKKLYIIIIVVVAIVLVFWWWSSRQVSELPLSTDDLNKEVQELDVNNIDEEFQQIDQELENL